MLVTLQGRSIWRKSSSLKKTAAKKIGLKSTVFEELLKTVQPLSIKVPLNGDRLNRCFSVLNNDVYIVHLNNVQ